MKYRKHVVYLHFEENSYEQTTYSMSFPFKRIIEHREYPNTFLRRVIVYASFETRRAEFFNEEVLENFRNYLSSMYNHKGGIGDFPKKILEISSEDGNTDISFYNGGFLLSFNQKGYKSFIDTVVPHLTRLRVFVEKIMKSTACDELRVRKVNIWQFGPKTNLDFDYGLTSRAVFSNDLINYPETVSLSEKEKALPLHSKITWKDDNKTINLLTGFVKLDSGASNLLLDTEFVESSNTQVSEMTDTMLRMNGTLFDVYQWSINDQVRSLMDKKMV